VAIVDELDDEDGKSTRTCSGVDSTVAALPPLGAIRPPRTIVCEPTSNVSVPQNRPLEIGLVPLTLIVSVLVAVSLMAFKGSSCRPGAVALGAYTRGHTQSASAIFHFCRKLPGGLERTSRAVADPEPPEHREQVEHARHEEGDRAREEPACQRP